MNDGRNSSEIFKRGMDIRLCRLRSWSNHPDLGFQLQRCSEPPHTISFVESNSPAAAGGLKFWDLVLAINGKNVSILKFDQVVKILQSAKKDQGQYLELLVIRGKYRQTIENESISILMSLAQVINTPIKMPNDYHNFEKYIPRTCKIRLRSNEKKFGFDATYGEQRIGLYIQEVAENSPAYHSGLRKCDRVIEVNDENVDKYATNLIIDKIRKSLIQGYLKLLVADTVTYETNVLKTPLDFKKPTSCTSDCNEDQYIYSESDPLNASELCKSDISNSEDAYLPCTPEAISSDDSYITASSITIDTTEQNQENEQSNQRYFDVQNERLTSLSPIKGYEQFPLVSLSKAIESFEKIKQNLPKTTNPTDDLTSDESAAIQLYTMEYKSEERSLCTQINNFLRAENQDSFHLYLPYLKLFLTALNKLKSTEMIVWRGVQGDLRDQYPIGKLFVWHGFSSCTKSRALLESDQYLGEKGLRTLFHIKCQTGKSIQLYSFHKHQDEVLLLPGTQFQVIDQERLSNNLFIISIKEIFVVKRSLKKFIESHQMYDSIEFSEEHLTIDNIDLITNEVYSNQFWKKVSFSQGYFTEDSMTMFMYSLQSNSTITSLDFQSNHINDQICSCLALGLRTNTTIKYLNLAKNQLTDISAKTIGLLLSINKTLETLDLSSNPFGDYGLLLISRAFPFNKTLKSLYLNQVQLTNKYIEEISMYLQQNTSLERLYLNENYLDDQSITSLCRTVVTNKQIKYLHLAKNQITHEGAKDIAMLLQEPTCSLLELNLNENYSLADAGFRLIAQSLCQNQTLTYLYLDSIGMTISCLDEIIQMIRANKTLKYLSLKNNINIDDGMKLISNELKFNSTLRYFYLNNDNLINSHDTISENQLSEVLRI